MLLFGRLIIWAFTEILLRFGDKQWRAFILFQLPVFFILFINSWIFLKKLTKLMFPIQQIILHLPLIVLLHRKLMVFLLSLFVRSELKESIGTRFFCCDIFKNINNHILFSLLLLHAFKSSLSGSSIRDFLRVYQLL